MRALPQLRLCAVLLATACSGGNEETIEQRACPADAGADTLTYDSFGKPFLDQWCNNCHGASASYRNGAPPSVAFDTHDEAIAWKARIFARAADDNTSMPVGPHGPPDDQRRQLGDWLACGAK